MTRRSDVPPALRALLETAALLARRSSTAQVAIARAAALVDPGALPPSLREPLSRELDAAVSQACRPLARKDVEKALRAAWRKPPGKILDDLDLGEPLAVRPASQVHRAAYEGRPVAVKVQRPGLAAATRNDLALLDALAVPLRAVAPGIDAGAILREVREATLDELDLEHEASMQRSVARALRGVEGLTIPKAHGELAAPGVLVTDLLEGPSLAHAVPDEPAAVGRTLVQAHLVAARDAGLALTDPRPGHVILRAAGGIGLLGAGLARPVNRDRVGAALAAARALVAGDAPAFAAAVAGDLGVLPAQDARRALPLLRDVAGDLLCRPARLDAAALGAAAERALDRVRPLSALAARATPQPSDLWPVRGAGQLTGVLARLAVTEDWASLVLAET